MLAIAELVRYTVEVPGKETRKMTISAPSFYGKTTKSKKQAHTRISEIKFSRSIDGDQITYEVHYGKMYAGEVSLPVMCYLSEDHYAFYDAESNERRSHLWDSRAETVEEIGKALCRL